MCIISAYAPTDCDDKQPKDAFYNDLKDIALKQPPNTLTIIAGDLNGRIGKDSQDTNPRQVGPHCMHNTTTDNGKRMLELCELADLRPAHTHFPNRKSRLLTYCSPKCEWSQLDHMLISTKWWKSLKNYCAYNTIDVGSDHKVMNANFKLSLRAPKQPTNNRCKFNWERLAEPEIKESFNCELKNRFSLLMDEMEALPSKTAKIQQHTILGC